jgi:hypothetical protein
MLEDGLDPLGVLFKEWCVVTWAEGGPHERVTEEVAGHKRVNCIEGESDLHEGMLWDHPWCGIGAGGSALCRDYNACTPAREQRKEVVLLILLLLLDIWLKPISTSMEVIVPAVTTARSRDISGMQWWLFFMSLIERKL